MREMCEQCNHPVETFNSFEVKLTPGNNYDIVTLCVESFCAKCDRFYQDYETTRNDRPVSDPHSTLREENRTYSHDG